MKKGRAGYACMEIGEYATAERVLRSTLATADQMGLQNVAATARHNLGLTLVAARAGRRGRAAGATGGGGLPRLGQPAGMEGASREYLALIRLEGGDLDGAEVDARAALAVAVHGAAAAAEPGRVAGDPGPGAAGAGTCGAVAGDGGRGAGAPGAAGRHRRWRGNHPLELRRGAGGHRRFAAARAAITAARDRLLARAARIPDEKTRHAFLAQVPENARTLERAREWAPG